MRGTGNAEAYDCYLRAQKTFTTFSEAVFRECIALYERAVDLDPNFARAKGGLAYTYVTGILDGFHQPEPDAAVLAKSESLAARAVALDRDDYANHWDLAFIFMNTGRPEAGLVEYEVALDLFDNRTDMLDRKPGLLLDVGEAYVYAGRIDEGIALIERAVFQVPDWYRWHLAFAYYCGGRYKDAIGQVESMYRQPGDPRYIVEAQLYVAASHACLGNDTAAAAAREFVEREKGPGWSLGEKLKRFKFVRDADKKHWMEGMRKAGFKLG